MIAAYVSLLLLMVAVFCVCRGVWGFERRVRVLEAGRRAVECATCADDLADRLSEAAEDASGILAQFERMSTAAESAQDVALRLGKAIQQGERLVTAIDNRSDINMLAVSIEEAERRIKQLEGAIERLRSITGDLCSVAHQGADIRRLRGLTASHQSSIDKLEDISRRNYKADVEAGVFEHLAMLARERANQLEGKREL